MTSRRNSSLKGTDFERLPIVEDLVPTPIFSGQARFNAPRAISFAPATTNFATPMTQGTLMADFAAEHRILRNWDDMFRTESFIQLVITWPGLQREWAIPMANVIGGRDYISRAELARFVIDQFSLFSTLIGASSCPSPEWKLGQAPDAYSTGNTCLAFLWSPAPGVWQPAFRVRNKPDNVQMESSVPYGAFELSPFNGP